MEPTPPKTDALLERLDRCPPFVCYYAAQRNRERRPTLAELVAASGLSESTFIRIGRSTSWARIGVEQMSQFSAACGVDLLDPTPVMEWLAVRGKSGQLLEDFDQCGHQGAVMMERFNLLSAKALLAKEKEEHETQTA